MHDVQRALQAVFGEVLEGPPAGDAYILNPGDDGLLGSLARLSAEAASARPDGRTSVAAHVHHVYYGIELLNRWLRGKDPYAGAKFADSWTHQAVDDARWRELRQALAREAQALKTAIGERATWDEEGWINVIAITVHLGYHLGAIRQLTAAAAGPRAAD